MLPSGALDDTCSVTVAFCVVVAKTVKLTVSAISSPGTSVPATQVMALSMSVQLPGGSSTPVPDERPESAVYEVILNVAG